MPEEQSEVDKLLDEHRGCLELLSKVEKCLDGFPATVSREELQRNLSRLTETLAQHFEGEEEGFLSQLPIEHPHLARSFKELEDEHDTILDALKALPQKVESAADSPEPRELETLKAQGRRLFLTIRRHEAEENELVMEAHWYTLGNMD